MALFEAFNAESASMVEGVKERVGSEPVLATSGILRLNYLKYSLVQYSSRTIALLVKRPRIAI